MTKFSKNISAIFNKLDNKIVDGLAAVQSGARILDDKIYDIQDKLSNASSSQHKAQLIGGLAADFAIVGGLTALAASVSAAAIPVTLVIVPIGVAGAIGGALAGRHYHDKLQQRKNQHTL